MTGKISFMDRSGHTEVAWNTDLEETVAAANERFNALLAGPEKYNAYDMSGGLGTPIKTFNPQADEILMVPPYVAG